MVQRTRELLAILAVIHLAGTDFDTVSTHGYNDGAPEHCVAARCTNKKEIMEKGTKWMLGITLLLGVATGAAAYVLLQQKDRRTLPPKKAPQLHLDNPGTQSEFPTSATESEIG